MIDAMVPRRMTIAAATAAIVASAVLHAKQSTPWWDRAEVLSSRHYRIKSDLPEGDVRRIGRHLDTMYEAYARRLASLPPRGLEHLDVMAFASQADYLTTLKGRFGIDATGTRGIFFRRQDGGGLAFWTGAVPWRRVEHVIQHEGFHQFAASRFGDALPSWVNEGVAEYFGASYVIGGRLVTGQAPPRAVAEVAAAVGIREHIPFGVMLTMTGGEWMARVQEGGASLLYRQAWSMAYFLVHGEHGRYTGAFEQYLRLINRGVRSEDAFADAFGTSDITAFEERWRTFALAQSPGTFAAAVERLEFLADGALALARSGVVPGTLEDLRGALQSTDFQRTVQRHGYIEVLRAEDASLYELPAISPGAPAPRLVVEVRRRPVSPRERIFAQRLPRPPDIGTDGLVPGDLAVVWHRDLDSGDLSWELEVGK